ncbi:Bloom syndrome [Hypsizygus marmoreus]|uniref:DNA 3'-5' helicase n=1 Tax=Hypsizygus marmoreus TaxID=39966 RepID=A0A369K2W5_HYPMA|nr:Bloom syndrome [Hypsizygus marmoreus]
MPDVNPHEQIHVKSQLLLEKARDAAAKERKYDSAKTRQDLTRLFREQSGNVPYDWQLDVTEATLLGLDSVIIAGTGSGKTIPFMLPLLLHPKKLMLIISPLKVLQKDQVRRFKKMKIPAVAVNGETWSPSLGQSLADKKHQAIFSSPEMCLKHPEFRKWLSDPETTKDMLGIIVDEAHCISQWGGDFRPLYADVQKLRALMPSHIPVLLTSATLNPPALKEVCSKMEVDLNSSFFLNRGNHRINITSSVIRMDGAKDFAAVREHLPCPDQVTSPEDFKKTIIFTNVVNDTQILCRDLRKHYDNKYDDSIAYLHANRTTKAKRRIMKWFLKGKIKILIATEAAGMGADIPDIELIIQFGVPKSLTIWTQRAGRGGRSSDMQAEAKMLVEKSMFETKRKKKPGGKKPTTTKKTKKRRKTIEHDTQQANEAVANAEEEALIDAEEMEWVKNVDEDMRKYAGTENCRTDVADSFFNNPPRAPVPGAVGCQQCDNCLRKRQVLLSASMFDDTQEQLSRPSTPTFPNSLPSTPSSSAPPSPSKLLNENGKRGMVSRTPIDLGETPLNDDPSSIKPSTDRTDETVQATNTTTASAGSTSTELDLPGPEDAALTASAPAKSTRRGEHLQAIRSSLYAWRLDIQRSRYSPSPFPAEVYLPEPVLTTLSSNRAIKTLDDMRVALLKRPWIYLEEHGKEILDLIKVTDQRFIEGRQQEAHAKKEARKQATAERRQAAEREKEQATLNRRKMQGVHRRRSPLIDHTPLLNGPHLGLPLTSMSSTSAPIWPSHPAIPSNDQNTFGLSSTSHSYPRVHPIAGPSLGPPQHYYQLQNMTPRGSQVMHPSPYFMPLPYPPTPFSVPSTSPPCSVTNPYELYFPPVYHAPSSRPPDS